jgi:hypothetical protein
MSAGDGVAVVEAGAGATTTWSGGGGVGGVIIEYMDVEASGVILSSSHSRRSRGDRFIGIYSSGEGDGHCRHKSAGVGRAC